MKALTTRQRIEIKARITAIWERVLFTKSCYKFCHRLYHPISERELEFQNFDRAFSFLRIVLLRTTILELVKLFSRPNGKAESREKKVCIYHFLDLLDKSGQYVHAGISQEKLGKWRLELDAKRSQIDNLLTFRDEVVAHQGKQSIQNSVSFSELRELISLAEDVVSCIYEIIFETSVYFYEGDFDSSISNLIECAVRPYAERMDTLETELKRLNDEAAKNE